MSPIGWLCVLSITLTAGQLPDCEGCCTLQALEKRYVTSDEGGPYISFTFSFSTACYADGAVLNSVSVAREGLDVPRFHCQLPTVLKCKDGDQVSDQHCFCHPGTGRFTAYVYPLGTSWLVTGVFLSKANESVKVSQTVDIGSHPAIVFTGKREGEVRLWATDHAGLDAVVRFQIASALLKSPRCCLKRPSRNTTLGEIDAADRIPCNDSRSECFISGSPPTQVLWLHVQNVTAGDEGAWLLTVFNETGDTASANFFLRDPASSSEQNCLTFIPFGLYVLGGSSTLVLIVIIVCCTCNRRKKRPVPMLPDPSDHYSPMTYTYTLPSDLPHTPPPPPTPPPRDGHQPPVRMLSFRRKTLPRSAEAEEES